ncbi:REP-associated tyrosine transposase [Halomonas sp. HNIBRBA4712]|uniref:REP-associated tyrosine transposase n=1 Tax=Halomonas sp. HNIBRBA4712 TaxID=3373087 RepID=UPI00374A0217
MHHGHRLRRGRHSLKGAYYLITIATHRRQPLFSNFHNACCASRHFTHPRVKVLAKTLSFVVMPDHVHWLMQLDSQLSEAVRRYKSHVSVSMGESAWQRGFHDRMIRDEESLVDVARYIVANPLRVQLVDDVNDYSFWDAVWLS